MRITTNNPYNSLSGCSSKFRELPVVQQYKIMDQLVTNATENEDPSGQMKSLANNLNLKSISHLNVSLVDTGEALNRPNAGDGVKELAEALGLEERVVDCALGSYAEQLAKQTNPQRPVYGGGNT